MIKAIAVHHVHHVFTRKESLSFLLCACIAAVLLISTATCAEAFKLPDTGQTKCYTTGGSEIACTGKGQDGSYIINPLSYAEANGTVTDNNTGLMWQQQDDGATYNWFKANGIYDASWNTTTQNACSINLAGYLDWRLPTVKELESLLDYSVASGPTISMTYFPTTISGQYWTATVYSQPSTSWWAWYGDFGSGYVSATAKSGALHVRCVRGGQYPAQSFFDNKDGTVSDPMTGLMWQQDEPGSMSWLNALNYCEGLPLAGYSDWRLPNIRALWSLTDVTKNAPSINTSYFPNAHGSPYWASSTDASATIDALSIEFGLSNTQSHGKTSSEYVRCVRGGLESFPLLQILKSGAGSGTVVSNSLKINCGSVCSAYYISGDVVSLTATPALGGSIFSGWSGDADCTDSAVIMSSDRVCTATFDVCSGKPAFVDATGYDSIGLAYANGAGASGDTIEAIASNQQEDLDFASGKDVVLSGGYNCAHDARVSYTTLTGSLTISAGSAIVEYISVQ